MSGLLFLSSDDFSLGETPKGKILCNKLRGFSLVFFYSTQCTYCQTFIQNYKKMPEMVNGCQFGLINISKNKEIVFMSRDTISPLQYVPYIILYNDGKPIVRYDGPHDPKELAVFIYEMAKKIQESKQVVPNNTTIKEDPKTGFIAYTPSTGRSDEIKVCYLNFEEFMQRSKK
jgi:thioredoxin-like negative regulator of GroEL